MNDKKHLIGSHLLHKQALKTGTTTGIQPESAVMESNNTVVLTFSTTLAPASYSLIVHGDTASGGSPSFIGLADVFGNLFNGGNSLPVANILRPIAEELPLQSPTA